MKTYTVQELAAIAGVTVRTLHHYDEIGLLTPIRTTSNKYRAYNETDLLTLQQIMFFKELDFQLDEIKRIMSDTHFDVVGALSRHKKVITQKKKRMEELLQTIDNTIHKINKKRTMEDQELYDGFSKEELKEWNKEAEQRWGHTDQYKQSVGRYESLTKKQKLQMEKDGDALMDEIVLHMDKGASSPEVQALVQRHYDSLRFFYEPTFELYRNLADMYVGYQGDTRFRTYFEKHHKRLPEFMRDAIYVFCDTHQ